MLGAIGTFLVLTRMFCCFCLHLSETCGTSGSCSVLYLQFSCASYQSKKPVLDPHAAQNFLSFVSVKLWVVTYNVHERNACSVNHVCLSARLSACFSLQIIGQIFIKPGMNRKQFLIITACSSIFRQLVIKRRM